MKIINSNKINRRSFIKRSGVAGGGLVITFNLLNSFNSLTPLSDNIDNIKYNDFTSYIKILEKCLFLLPILKSVKVLKLHFQ